MPYLWKISEDKAERHGENSRKGRQRGGAVQFIFFLRTVHWYFCALHSTAHAAREEVGRRVVKRHSHTLLQTSNLLSAWQSCFLSKHWRELCCSKGRLRAAVLGPWCGLPPEWQLSSDLSLTPACQKHAKIALIGQNMFK